jgi:UDP-N-acetylglucosamine 2-epimerase
MKIVTIVGAHTQFIKCSPVTREPREEINRATNDNLSVVLFCPTQTGNSVA